MSVNNLKKLQEKPKSKPVKVIQPPPPTYKRPGYEDDAQHIDIKKLVYLASKNGSDVVYSGTDYGLVTQSTTIRMTANTFKAHMEVYNHFSALENLEDSSMLSEEAMKVVCQSDKAHRITSGEIQQRSLTRAHTRKRNKRKVRASSDTLQDI
jgi:hypothetical protein